MTVKLTSEFITTILDLYLLAAAVAPIFARSFRKFFLGGLRALLVPVIVLFYGMFIGRNHYVVNELEIVSRDVPESFDGYRIVQISDLHLESFGSRSRSLARAVSKVNALNPDLILFTGDLVTSHPSEMDGLEHVLSGLEAKDGICSVLGNHDYCIYRRWESDSLRAAAVRELVAREESLGWHVLMNSCVNIVRPRSGESSASSSAPDSFSGNLPHHLLLRIHFPCLLPQIPSRWLEWRTSRRLHISLHTATLTRPWRMQEAASGYS